MALTTAHGRYESDGRNKWDTSSGETRTALEGSKEQVALTTAHGRYESDGRNKWDTSSGETRTASGPGSSGPPGKITQGKSILVLRMIGLIATVPFSRLSAVEADGCQVSRPLRGLHDFTPTACVRSMRTWGGAWHVDLIWTWEKRGGHGPRGEDLGGV